MKLTVVGLADFGKLHPQALSGGMKKRGAVARALSLDPEILVLDEPTAGLDPIAAATLDELILLLKQTLQMTGARLSEESRAAEEMIARFTRWQSKSPQSIAADASYGNGELLQWLMDPQITP